VVGDPPAAARTAPFVEIYGRPRHRLDWIPPELSATLRLRGLSHKALALLRTGNGEALARPLPRRACAAAGCARLQRHARGRRDAKLGLSPLDSGVRVASVFELGARSAEAAPGVSEQLLALARSHVVGWQLDSDGSVDAWAVLRPTAPDGPR
jgi:hypothetical protein